MSKATKHLVLCMALGFAGVIALASDEWQGWIFLLWAAVEEVRYRIARTESAPAAGGEL